MNNNSLKEFTNQLVVVEVGHQISERAIDACMIISTLLRQATDYYRTYQDELQHVGIDLETALSHLKESNAAEIRASKNKQAVVMAEVSKTLAAFKKQTGGIIHFLEQNQRQVDSASPTAQLKLRNLLREQQGLKPLKRLPKGHTLATTPTLQTA